VVNGFASENDPWFVSDSDYHIQAFSLAVDNGSAVYTPDYDIDGDGRTLGVGGDDLPDIGCDEYDKTAPTETISSAVYDPDNNTMTITGTDFLTIAAVDRDIRSYVDWSKFVWDINGDDATTADITFIVDDVTSLTVDDDITMTLVFTAAKGAAIEAATGYGADGGADTLDVTAGFSRDAMGNTAAADGVADALMIPTDTITSAVYNAGNDTMTISGTGFTTIAAKGRDIKSYVNWSRFVWDINGDDGTDNITFTVGDVASLTVTDDTTLTLVFTEATGTAVEATTGYGAEGGADTLDVTAGFSLDALGNAATTDAVTDGPVEFTPTDTITSADYDADSNTMTITGSDFTTIASADTEIKAYVDWTKFVWDINGDGGTTADITFVEGDVVSLTVTDDTTLTLVFTADKSDNVIEAAGGYGTADGNDTLDVTAGFSKDVEGNAATTDGVANAPINF